MKALKSLSVASLMLVGTLAAAHEFWLEPVKFLLAKNELVRVDLMVGEDYTGEHSNGNKYKITKLDHYSGKKIEDIKTKIAGDSLSTMNMSFANEGGHLIAFNNTSKFIELEPLKFNDYLRSEGLDNAAQMRAKAGDTLKPGRELYQRCVKTLVQVGSKLDNTYALNTGLRLEIIPQQNPYAVKKTSPIRFKILFDGKPLANAYILAWHAVNGTTTHTTMRSDAAGMVKFPITRSGKWMISTVQMIPSEEPAKADWQSFWGSFTFGYL